MVVLQQTGPAQTLRSGREAEKWDKAIRLQIGGGLLRFERSLPAKGGGKGNPINSGHKGKPGNDARYAVPQTCGEGRRKMKEGGT